MTRSLRSVSSRKTISTSSPSGLDVRSVILGTDASRAVGSTADVAVGVDGAGSERQRGDVALADRAQAEDEPASAIGSARLIGMAHDARIEQGRRFERILVQEVGADQLALRLRESRVRLERIFHFGGPRLEDIEQVPVPAFEILQHLGKLLGRRLGIEAEHAVDDVIGPGLVGLVEVPRLGRRLEGAHDDPRRIRAQIQGLAIEEHGLRQGGSLGWSVVDCENSGAERQQ